MRNTTATAHRRCQTTRQYSRRWICRPPPVVVSPLPAITHPFRRRRDPPWHPASQEPPPHVDHVAAFERGIRDAHRADIFQIEDALVPRRTLGDDLDALLARPLGQRAGGGDRLHQGDSALERNLARRAHLTL